MSVSGDVYQQSSRWAVIWGWCTNLRAAPLLVLRQCSCRTPLHPCCSMRSRATGCRTERRMSGNAHIHQPSQAQLANVDSSCMTDTTGGNGAIHSCGRKSCICKCGAMPFTTHQPHSGCARLVCGFRPFSLGSAKHRFCACLHMWQAVHMLLLHAHSAM